MADKSVFCLIRDEAHACRIIEGLQSAGFSPKNISVLLPDQSGTRDFAHEKGTKAPEGALAGVGAGGVLGGALGLVAGLGALAIPGLGPFLAAGPLMAALGGAALGATAGGLVGALIGLGVPEYKAKRYEGKLREGRVLMSIHCRNASQVRLAQEILELAHAEDIAVAGEKEIAEPEPRDPTAVKRRSARF